MEYPICRRGHVKSPDNLTSNGQCKLCRCINSRNHYVNNKDKFRKRNVEYNIQCPTAKKKASQKYVSKTIKNVTRLYVSSKLDIRVGQLTDALYELAKEHILLHRAIKELNQTIKEIGSIND